MADEGNVSEMFNMLKGQLDVITTGLAELKGQMEVMNGKLEQISKDTDIK